MVSKPIRWAGRALRKAGNEILKRNGIQETWIDVGAHWGEKTLSFARHNPGLRVFAIEPNLRAAAKLLGALPNYFVIPIAIAETNGCADFHLNSFEAASSLLPLNKGVASWGGGTALSVESTVQVPTLRLETLINILGIDKVDFLKIDAQGMDLAIVRSAGKRLTDIAKITLEVWLTPQPQYVGTPSKEEVLRYMDEHGFSLQTTEQQTDGLEENLTFVRTR